MWDVCFYTWLIKCNTCVMFYSDKFLNKQLLLEQYFHLLSFFSPPLFLFQIMALGQEKEVSTKPQLYLLLVFLFDYKCVSFAYVVAVYHIN